MRFVLLLCLIIKILSRWTSVLSGWSIMEKFTKNAPNFRGENSPYDLQACSTSIQHIPFFTQIYFSLR